MRYIRQHIETIIVNYNGAIPLAHFLRNYFRLHPKLGSRDRKALSEMAYCWYRFSKALPGDLALEEKMQACLFACGTEIPFLIRQMPEAYRKTDLDTQARIEALISMGIEIAPDQLLSFAPDLSEGIERKQWLLSMLRQPGLFIRLRKAAAVRRILEEKEIPYEEIAGDLLALANGTAIDKILPAESYVVQDASSQQTGKYFRPEKGENWWDCCAGAGGKSLLLKDREPSVRLTVSDRRASILHNLAERFKLYGLSNPRHFLLDVSSREDLSSKLSEGEFDNIICDAPCTGSGTWARTPEQLYFFKEAYLPEFTELQKTIAGNVVPFLKKGGRLIYITCSVFRQENEEVVSHLAAQYSLKAETEELINGTGIKSDSMFVAVLRK